MSKYINKKGNPISLQLENEVDKLKHIPDAKALASLLANDYKYKHVPQALLDSVTILDDTLRQSMEGLISHHNQVVFKAVAEVRTRRLERKSKISDQELDLLFESLVDETYNPGSSKKETSKESKKPAQKTDTHNDTSNEKKKTKTQKIAPAKDTAKSKQTSSPKPDNEPRINVAQLMASAKSEAARKKPPYFECLICGYSCVSQLSSAFEHLQKCHPQTLKSGNGLLRNRVMQHFKDTYIFKKTVEPINLASPKAIEEAPPNPQDQKAANQSEIDKSKVYSNKKSPESLKNDTKNIVTVKVSDLLITDRLIRYKEYRLRQPRIKAVPPEILRQIDLALRIQLKPWCLGLAADSFKFVDQQESDLLFLEVERLLSVAKVGGYANNCPPTGVFALPWEFVRFYEQKMLLIHPNASRHGQMNPFYYRHSSIRTSFADLLAYIKRVALPLQVEARDGEIVRVLNFRSFENIIPQLKEAYTGVNDTVDIIDAPYGTVGRAYTKQEFERQIKRSKSPYLAKLSQMQLAHQRIFYLLEVNCHASSETSVDEYGYLFNIRERYGQSTLLFENITDESRSTIVFTVDTAHIGEAVTEIRKFLAGSIANKREKMSRRIIQFNSPSILSYDRIIHTDYSSWALTIRRMKF